MGGFPVALFFPSRRETQMVKRPDPIVEDGENRLFVGSWKSAVFSLKPHVTLSIESGRSGKSATMATMKLTPSDARRVAIVILQEAEKADLAMREAAEKAARKVS
jgi:hypothetical protein